MDHSQYVSFCCMELGLRKTIQFVSVLYILVILLLLNSCNGCQRRASAISEDPAINPIIQPVDSIVDPDDSIKEDTVERTDSIGHDGKLKVTLLWDFPADIDLHVEQPNGFEIYYKDKHKQDSQTGGFLDVDNKVGGVGSAENICWANPLMGEYAVSLVYFRKKNGGEDGGPCTVVVKREINGQSKTESFCVNMRVPKNEKVYITYFVIP